jgi:hypothetical protein
MEITDYCCVKIGFRCAKSCGGGRIYLNEGDKSYLMLLSSRTREFVVNDSMYLCCNHRDYCLKPKLKQCIAAENDCPNPNLNLSLRKCPRRVLTYFNLHETTVVSIHKSCLDRITQETNVENKYNDDVERLAGSNNDTCSPLTDITYRHQEIAAHEFIIKRQAVTTKGSPIQLAGKRGRPTSFCPIPRIEVGYRDASPSCKSKRQQIVNVVISQLSTSSNCSDVENQVNRSQFMTDLVRRHAEEFDTRILNQRPNQLTQVEAIKLRTKLNLTWRQERVLVSYLKSVGCNVFPSEKSIRQKQAEFNYEWEHESIEINKEQIIFVRAADPILMLEQQIKYLNQSGELTTHDGLIPDGEIWINLLGDKGGHSTKLVASILNYTKPLTRNQVVLALYEGASEDYSVVTHVFGPVFDRLYEWSRNFSTSSVANFNRIRLFYGGDMKWLWMLLGLSQNGKHGCVYCLSDDDKKQGAPRTFQHHVDQHNLFIAAGANNNKAKIYYNCINMPVIKTAAFNNTAPMPLHTFLGMGQLCLDIARDMCIELDRQLVDLRAIAAEIPTAEQFQQLWDTNQQIESEIEAIEQQLVVFYTAIHENVDNSSLERGEDSLSKQASELEKAKVKLKQDLTNNIRSINSVQGYFLRQFNQFLLSIKVVRKGNFGHSLVGSEVHSLFKAENIVRLTNIMRSQAIVMIDGVITTLGNNAGASSLKRLLNLLVEMYVLCTSPRKLTENEITTLATTAQKLSQHYSTAYPNRSVTPKLHNLIFHFPTIAKLYKTIGLFSEHSIESVHKRFKQYDASYCSIKDPEQHLLYSAKLNALTIDARF